MAPATLAQLRDLQASEHGDVGGHDRKHARRQERHQPAPEGGDQGHVSAGHEPGTRVHLRTIPWNAGGDGSGSLRVPSGEQVQRVERERAFAQYVVPEIDVLLRVATSLTGNLADAEDLVQDTLIRAYRAADRFDGRHPRAWLLTILRNAQRNRVRGRRPELLRDPDTEGHRIEEANPSPSAEGEALAAEFDAVVAEAFAKLPRHMREVVELVDFDGLSYREAADALGVPPGTVMSRLHRARQRIRRYLDDRGVSHRGQVST
ncbi:MAG: sigma-70 family RNA polymerase sigma factor [Actinobacteria bacterium]|nr:sigma-70 family RNA polymerase sigma factor [Actinomycetota bacterium]